MTVGSGWRTALRLARRSVRRSLLIIALVSVPVMAATVADGIVRTLTDHDVRLDQAMGSADARIDTRQPFDVAQALPPGTRSVPHYTGDLRLSVGDRTIRTRLRALVPGDPLTAHLARLTAGRLPANPHETLVTPRLAEQLGLLDADGNLRPHAAVTPAGGQAVAVTGLAIEPYCLACADVVAPPDTAMLDGAMLDGGYLVDLPPGVGAAALASTWPPGGPEIVTRQSFRDDTPFWGAIRLPIILFAGLAMTGIVIAAGAAFAAGARGRLRELGLLAADGGTATHVRRVVLAQGVVLGVVGSATGLVAGAVVLVLGTPLWRRLTGQLMEDPRFGWGELAVAAAAGILVSVVASAAPAVGAARTQPADALAGRVRSARPATRVRFLGVALVLTGAAAVVGSGVVVRAGGAAYRPLTAAPPPEHTLPVIGTVAGVVVSVIGLVLVMPAAVTAAGRLGDLLPLSGRLAVRDAVRHRDRTVAACAAITVTVAGVVVAVASSRSGPHYLTAGLAAPAALLAAGVTAGSSGADGRADLATLAALGAPPRRRRTLAGAHALVVTVLGTLSGLAVGAGAAFAAGPLTGVAGPAVPWPDLLVTALAVPVLASAVAALATPSRLPVVVRS